MSTTPTTNKISTSNINVYPCANRTGTDINAYMNTEYNIVSIVNRLVDQKSFVVSNAIESSSKFVFNINGYLFTVDSTELTGKTVKNNYLYAIICVGETSVGNTPTTTTTFKELIPIDVDVSEGMDNSGVFNGVVFKNFGTLLTNVSGWQTSYTSTISSDSIFQGITISNSGNSQNITLYTLPILFRSSSDKYTIPDISKIKFMTSNDGTCRSIKIDDGELGSST